MWRRKDENRFILSVFLNPLFTFIHQRLQLPKTISVALAIFVSILVVSIPLSIIATLLIRETSFMKEIDKVR